MSRKRMALASKVKTKEQNDAEVFAELKRLFAPYASQLSVKEDSERSYYLETKSVSYRGGPMFFGAVKWKSYVSFHLMPIYIKPELLEGLSPELKKRMQGKSCFNFRNVEPLLFEELAELTRDGFEFYKEAGFLEGGRPPRS